MRGIKTPRGFVIGGPVRSLRLNAAFAGGGGVVSPPVNAVAPTVTGTAQEGETLTAVPGTWTGSGITYTYQWRNDLGTNLGTGTTYVIQSSDVGRQIRVRETATNAGGADTVASSLTSTVVALWQPTDLGTNLKHWWNADDVSNGAVSTWTDRVGSLAATQATGGLQPVAAIGTASKRWVTFDGTDDYLRTSGVGSAPVGSTTGEMYVLADFGGGAGTGTRHALGYGATSGAGSTRYLGNSGSFGRAASQATTLTDTVTSVGNVVAVIDAQTTSALLTLHSQGGATTPATAALSSVATTSVSITIGAGNQAAGSVASFFANKLRHAIITLGLSAGDQQKLQGWLAWDVGAQSNLVAGHPYRTIRPGV